MTFARRVSLIIPALLIALPAAALNLVTHTATDLASAPACPAPTYSGATATVTCGFTGGQQTWTVPPAITSATFAVYGAQGGNLGGGIGGNGGSAVATIAVTPLSTYTVVVGGAGSTGGAGFNGGGANGGPFQSGGGGGASDVRSPGTDLASRILVAGGGGGGGLFSTHGGSGGGLIGTIGGNAGGLDGTPGGPGTQVGGGGGGGGGCCGSGGTAGALGTGGNGGTESSGAGGGGGGGGYYGGGGAGDNSAGGGGSGFGPAGTTFGTGVHGGSGLVVITFTLLASSVTLTSSQNPSDSGESVPFTATVSSAGGTPTGTVTFLDGGSSIGTATLVGGVATLTTSSLAIGSHTITASYGGDTSFNSATGSLTGNPQVVNKADTSVSVATSFNPSLFGSSVTFTATESAVAPGSGTPTGTVTFLDGGSPIGTGSLVGGAATFATSALAVGNHTITTSYGGDGNFNGSTGSLTGNPQTVNKADARTSMTSTANPQSFGHAVTFIATVSALAPGAGSPTGTVTFLDGGSPIGTGTLLGGFATFTTSALAVGNHTITTSYGGDGNFNGSAGALTGNPEVIDRDGTSVTLTSSQNPSTFGESVTFTATVSSAGGTPTGTVTFLDGGTAIGTGTLSGGVTTLTTSALAIGPHTITASYGGSGSFNGSTGALTGTPQVVSKADTTTQVTSSVNPTVYGQSVTFVASVNATPPGVGTATGTVTFMDGGTPIGTGSLTAGVVRFTISALAVGNHIITASYGGDGNFNASAGAQSDNPEVVSTADTATSLITSQNPSVFGESLTFTATVGPVSPGAGTPTGTVTFLDGGSVIGTGPLSGGVATFATSALAVGNHAITTTYPGDGNFNGSVGALAGTPQVVNTANTTTSVNSTSPSAVGQAVTFTAAVAVTAPGAGTPTGTFAFTNDGNAVAGCGTVAIAPGTCVISETSSGSHTVAATYSGDADFTGSTGTTTQSVGAASTTTVLTLSSASGVVGGQNVTATAVVSVVSPSSGTPGGSVTFADGSKVLGSAALVSGAGGDHATFTTPFAAGTHSITATYNADADYATSTSSPAALTVAAGATAVTLSSAPDPAVAGQNVTLTAVVTPNAPSTQAPTGTVQFYDGTTLLGTAALKADAPLAASKAHSAASVGAATAALTTVFAAGQHHLTAVYVGNIAYASASSTLGADVEEVNAVTVPSTGGASSIVQLGALLMLAGLGWTGAALRRRRALRRRH